MPHCSPAAIRNFQAKKKTSHLYIHSLKLTVRTCQEAIPKEHPFSGAILVSGRVFVSAHNSLPGWLLPDNSSVPGCHVSPRPSRIAKVVTWALWNVKANCQVDLLLYFHCCQILAFLLAFGIISSKGESEKPKLPSLKQIEATNHCI